MFNNRVQHYSKYKQNLEAKKAEGEIRDMELGSEGKSCCCCGKSKKFLITDSAIKVETETCWISSEQVKCIHLARKFGKN